MYCIDFSIIQLNTSKFDNILLLAYGLRLQLNLCTTTNIVTQK